MNNNFGSLSLSINGKLVHNIFNINLTKFGHVNGEKCFLLLNLEWSHSLKSQGRRLKCKCIMDKT